VSRLFTAARLSSAAVRSILVIVTAADIPASYCLVGSESEISRFGNLEGSVRRAVRLAACATLIGASWKPD
jgi:hypothetical protein